MAPVIASVALYYTNPFVPNAPFLYPLKTSENQKTVRFSDVSGGRERVDWERMG